MILDFLVALSSSTGPKSPRRKQKGDFQIHIDVEPYLLEVRVSLIFLDVVGTKEDS